jgi:hypothetical protein
MASLKASYNVDLGHLKHTKDVWFRDASFVDASGTATFTKDETDHLNLILSNAGVLFRSINGKVLNQIALNETYRTWIKTFNNTKVRAGEAIENTTIHTNEFIRWLDAKMSASIADAKQQRRGGNVPKRKPRSWDSFVLI